ALGAANCRTAFQQANQGGARIVSAKSCCGASPACRGRSAAARGSPAGLQRLAAVSEAVTYRCLPRLDRASNSNRAAPANQLYAVRPALYAARAGGGRRGGTRRPESLRLAAISEAVTVRSLLQQQISRTPRATTSARASTRESIAKPTS